MNAKDANALLDLAQDGVRLAARAIVILIDSKKKEPNSHDKDSE